MVLQNNTKSMKSSINLFNEHNKRILSNLIPDKTTPICGKSIIDVNDPIFNEPLSKIIKYVTRN